MEQPQEFEPTRSEVVPMDLSTEALSKENARLHNEMAHLQARLSVAEGALERLFASGRNPSDQQSAAVRAEEALRKSELRFYGTFENAAVGMAHVALDGRWLRVNQRICDVLGYHQEELLGQRAQELTHPDDRRAEQEFTDMLLRGEIESYRMEKRCLHKQGHFVWVNLTNSLQRHPNGEPDYLISIVQDISERKKVEEALHEREAELRSLNETLEVRVMARTLDLERANRTLEQRNRELQDFAFIASHDLQEPLRKVRAFSDLMLTDYGEQVDETGRYYLRRMQNAASRMSQLITDLLTFSQIVTKGQPFQQVDLTQVAREVVSDLEIQVQEAGGVVEFGELAHVEADRTQMRQLVQNLVSNALKFRREDVPPRVRIDAQVETGTGDRFQGRRVVRLAVEDNGIGFDPKYEERIFSPFEQLHGRGAYEGTGMGLAICRRIVERHGGAISVETRPGGGSTFTVTLPLARDQGQAPAA